MKELRYRAAEQHLWAANGVRPAEQRIHLQRTGADVRVQEVGAGPPILFVHGANTSGASWIALSARLPDFRCLIVDRPGTGLSVPLSGRLDAERVARLGDDFVADVLDALAISEAHLVATSLGGYIALRSAAAHGDRLLRMVQFSWPVGAPTAWLPMVMRISAIPGLGRLMASLPATNRSVRMMFRQIGHRASLEDGRITRVDLDAYLALLRCTPTLREDHRIARIFVSPRHGLNRALLSRELLGRVDTPIHFLWGEHDPFGGPATGRLLVEALPRASLEVVPDAGHAPWLDQLDFCASRVREYLSDGAPGSAHEGTGAVATPGDRGGQP